jgi:cyclophilin family peptidyl-prolyl cis-trans isomerase
MKKTGLIFASFVILLIVITLILLPPQKSSPDQASQPTGEPPLAASDSARSVPKMKEGGIMEKKQVYGQPPAMTIDQSKTYLAKITTNLGVMNVKLNPKTAPTTVNNFIFLSREGFYDQTVFHRIIKGFMIQGGDPTGTGTGSPGYRFDDEPVTEEYTRGTIAMANSGPDTNGSQFFIMHADYPLPKNYVIFGRIDPSDLESLATLDKIAATTVIDNGQGELSKPAEPLTVSTVEIEE